MAGGEEQTRKDGVEEQMLMDAVPGALPEHVGVDGQTSKGGEVPTSEPVVGLAADGFNLEAELELEHVDVDGQTSKDGEVPTSEPVAGLAAAGFDVSVEMSERSTRALEELRDENGVFAYFLYGSGIAPHATIAEPSGDVGRGPACELAMYRMSASDEERLGRSVDLFLSPSPSYAAPQGKALMHAGPKGQGCHYLLFDYVHAACATAAVDPDPRRRVLVQDLVLDCRQADGSFLDTPILGHAYGTAMALQALVALDRPR